MGLFGPPDVEKLKAKRDVPGLIKALAYEKDPGVRRLAAQALGEIGGALGVGPLIAALSEVDVRVREAAVLALGATGDPRAVQPLIEVLRGLGDGQTDESIRAAAAAALGVIGDAGSIAALVDALSDPSSNVVQAAGVSLRRMGAAACDALIARLTQADASGRIVTALAGIGEAAVPKLVAALAAGRPVVRADAARALGKIAGVQAIEVLVITLGTEAALVSEAAASALLTIGPRATEKLVEALTGPDVRRSAAAADVLRRSSWAPGHGEAAFVYWIRLLSDRDATVRNRAVDALSKLADPRAVEPLIQALATPPAESQYGAAKALGKIGDPRALKLLLKSTRSPDEALRAHALEALAEIAAKAPETLDLLLANPDRAILELALRQLFEAGDTRAIEPLCAVLAGDAEDPRFRRFAAGALGSYGDARAIPALVSALGSPDSPLREAAAAALVKMPDPAAFEPLTRLFDDEDESVRCRAVEAVGALRDPRSVAALRTRVNDESARVRGCAVRALGALGAAEATESVAGALTDSDHSVRMAAVHALEELGSPAADALCAALAGPDETLRPVAARTLKALGASAVEPLVGILGGSSPEVRTIVVQLLEQAGWTPDASQAGVTYLAATGAWDRCVAIGDAAVGPLSAYLTDRGFKEACDALVQIRTPRSIRALCAALADRSTEREWMGSISRAVAEALVRCGSDAADSVTELLTSYDSEIRSRAEGVLNQVGWPPGPRVRAYVDRLIADLHDRVLDTRMSAARSLVRLYQAGTMPDELRRRILEQRGEITASHFDHKTQTHTACFGIPDDHDEWEHSDGGIGVPFPL